MNIAVRGEQPPIETIVFDLGGVLVDWNPDYVFDKVFHDCLERKQYFYEHICTSDWNEAQDAGRSLHEATESLVEQFPDWESEIRAFYGRWPEMLGGAIEEVVRLLKYLKEETNYKIVALTNWSAETFPIACERFEFFSWFDGIVVSGVEKTRKPFEDFFQIMFSRYSVRPESAIFIDDNLRNVAAGRNLGMRSIHFRNATELKSELVKLGIAINFDEA